MDDMEGRLELDAEEEDADEEERDEANFAAAL
jgi:hypothetical protein